MKLDPVWKKYIIKADQIENQVKFDVKLAIKNNLAFGVILKPSSILIGVTIYADVAELR